MPVDDLRIDFSGGMGEVVEGGDGGAPGPNEGIPVGMLFVLGFGEQKGRTMGLGECSVPGRVRVP